MQFSIHTSFWQYTLELLYLESEGIERGEVCNYAFHRSGTVHRTYLTSEHSTVYTPL